MKTLQYEHKPLRLDVMEVSLKDLDEIAEAMGAVRYVVTGRVGGSILIRIILSPGGNEYIVEPGHFVCMQESGYPLIFQTKEDLELVYRKTRKKNS